MKLSRFETALLEVLQAAAGDVVSRTVLEAALIKVRPYHDIPSENSNVLEVLIGRIRRKLPLGTAIEVIRGTGYRLKITAMCDRCTKQPATQSVLVEGSIPVVVCGDCLTQRQNQTQTTLEKTA